MKKSVLLLIGFFLALGTFSAAAQEQDDNTSRWLNEVREYKHSFLARELDLSREQQQKFFPIYDRMEDELGKVNSDVRAISRRISALDPSEVTDTDYDMAIQAIYEAKGKEAEIEQRYLTEFKEVLTKQQLFKLKGAEQRFNMGMMRRHHQLKGRERSQH